MLPSLKTDIRAYVSVAMGLVARVTRREVKRPIREPFKARPLMPPGIA